MIIVPEEILADLIAHANEHTPVEACGLLAGCDGSVSKSYRLTNIDGSHEHFSLDPKEQFAAVKDMRSQGLEMIAVYHSHPASPARMSDEDLRLAFMPGIRHVIVSIQEADLPVIKSFVVEDGRVVEEHTLFPEL